MMKKKTGLRELANDLLKKTNTPIAEIIIDIRTRHPELDAGTISKNTKTMLERFIVEIASVSTQKSSHTEEQSSAANPTTRR